MPMTKETARAQKRLQRQYDKISSYAALADLYDVTKGTLYNFVAKGIVPANHETRVKLGIEKEKTIDPSPKLISTRTRQEKLNMIARELGYENWSNYGTRMIEKWENHNQGE